MQRSGRSCRCKWQGESQILLAIVARRVLISPRVATAKGGAGPLVSLDVGNNQAHDPSSGRIPFRLRLGSVWSRASEFLLSPLEPTPPLDPSWLCVENPEFSYHGS